MILVESPDVPIIGVGEGTWPSMRMTLQTIGLPVAELLRQCEASFKQGTRFTAWARQGDDSRYVHPFGLPAEYATLNLAEHWLATDGTIPFADYVTPQAAVIAAGLAPKQPATPEYAFNVNYGYHFYAGKFAHLLHQHAVARPGRIVVLGASMPARTVSRHMRSDRGRLGEDDLRSATAAPSNNAFTVNRWTLPTPPSRSASIRT